MERKTETYKFAVARLSEMKVLDILWAQGEMPANQIWRILQDKTGWKKSTTYTVLQKCIVKGFIERIDPKFVCRPLMSREEMEDRVIAENIELYFGGSRRRFFSAFLEAVELTTDELQSVSDMLEQMSNRLH